jgi:hypothetical protein
MTYAACGVPLKNKGAQFVAIGVSLGVIASLVIGLRLGFKLYARIPIEVDDWLLVATASIGIPAAVINIHGLTSNGMGRDIWTLQPQTITSFLSFYLAFETVYYAKISLLKLSLLFFYLRIFPSRGIRRVLWVTVVVAALYGGLFVLIALTQCQPISYFWTNWDGVHPGTCLDMKAIAWMNAGIGIAIDLWMLAVPLYEIRSLNLHWKKKIGVGLMFGVGTL